MPVTKLTKKKSNCKSKHNNIKEKVCWFYVAEGNSTVKHRVVAEMYPNIKSVHEGIVFSQ